MLSVKQNSIKYHFLSLWYDSTRDWTQVSWTIGKHSIDWAKSKKEEKKELEKNQYLLEDEYMNIAEY